jgi:hypothetical protein
MAVRFRFFFEAVDFLRLVFAFLFFSVEDLINLNPKSVSYIVYIQQRYHSQSVLCQHALLCCTLLLWSPGVLVL